MHTREGELTGNRGNTGNIRNGEQGNKGTLCRENISVPISSVPYVLSCPCVPSVPLFFPCSQCSLCFSPVPSSVPSVSYSVFLCCFHVICVCVCVCVTLRFVFIMTVSINILMCCAVY